MEVMDRGYEAMQKDHKGQDILSLSWSMTTTDCSDSDTMVLVGCEEAEDLARSTSCFK